MTDVLYVVGNEGDGTELRWSLRSLAMHAKNVGRVVVAGYCPDWLADCVVKVPCANISTIKHRNIMACILAAIDAGAVRGDFLYSSDDHFLGKDVDFAAWPYYFKPGRLFSCEELRARGINPTEYEAVLSCTKKVLDAHGLRTDLFCNHCNTWMSTEDAPRVKELIASADPYDAENYGFEPTCLFMACRMERKPVELTKRCDFKIYGYDEVAVEGIFSTGDGMTDKLWDYLATKFFLPSQYEVEGEIKRRRKGDGAKK